MESRIQLVIFLALVSFCVQVSSQRFGALTIGRCPKKTEMKKLDINQFKGDWYEVERSFYLMEMSSSCTQLTFTPTSAGDIKVTVKSVSRLTGNPSVSLGQATPSFTGSSTFKYRVETRLPAALARALPGAGTYTILSTDYDNYAILWSCSNMGFMHSDLVWVLGRHRELSVSSRAQVYDHLLQHGIESDRLVLSKNEKCPNF